MYTRKCKHKVMIEGAQSPKPTIKSEPEILGLTCGAKHAIALTEANGKFSIMLACAGCWPFKDCLL